MCPQQQTDALSRVRTYERMAHCDFSLAAVAQSVADAGGNHIESQPCSSVFVDGHGSDVMKVMDSISALPKTVPVIARATGAALASILFMAQIQGRPVHVTQVRDSSRSFCAYSCACKHERS